jgi:hypothetical protein
MAIYAVTRWECDRCKAEVLVNTDRRPSGWSMVVPEVVDHGDLIPLCEVYLCPPCTSNLQLFLARP